MHLIWIFHFYLQFLLFILLLTENNLVWLQKPDEFLKHLIDPVIEGNWSKRCAIDIFHRTDILYQTEWRNFRNLLSSNMQRRIFARPTYCGVHNTSVVWCFICTSICYTPKCAIIAMMATHKILSHLYQPEHWINCRMEQLSYEVFTVDFYLNATSSEINAISLSLPLIRRCLDRIFSLVVSCFTYIGVTYIPLLRQRSEPYDENCSKWMKILIKKLKLNH